MLHIATIRSKPHARVHNLIILNDEGFYELEVHMDEEEMKASGDPFGFVKKTISEHLVVCIRATKLPLNEGLWDVFIGSWAQKEFNLPGGFTA